MHALTEREIRIFGHGQLTMDVDVDEAALERTGHPVRTFRTMAEMDQDTHIRALGHQDLRVPQPETREERFAFLGCAIRKMVEVEESRIDREQPIAIIDNRASHAMGMPMRDFPEPKPHRILVNLAKHLGTNTIHLSQRGVPIVYANGKAACWFGSKEKRYVKVFFPAEAGKPNPPDTKSRVFRAADHPRLVSDVAEFMLH